MAEEKISHKFRSNKIDGTRNYFIEEMKQNDLMSKKYKKVCTASKYVKQSLVLNFAVTLCFNFYVFFVRWYSNSYCKFRSCRNVCAMTARIKKYEPIIKKKRKKNDEIVLITKTELNAI